VLLGVLEGLVLQVADHLVDVVLQGRDLAGGGDRDGPGEVALGDGGGDLGDGPYLGGQVGGQLGDVVGEVLPGAGGGGHAGLAAELAFDADFAGHGRHLVGEGGQGVDHAVDRVGQGGDLALGFHRQLALEVAVGDGGHDLGDAAHLRGQVAGHEVHGVGQVLPGTRHALHLGLTAQDAFGADFPCHAGHFRGEGGELVHHRADRVLECEDPSCPVHRELPGQVAHGDRFRDVGDVADLAGEVAGHEVVRVGEVLPGAGDVAHVGLAAQLPFRADFPRHAGHLGGEGAQLVDHRVDGVFQFENLAAD